MDWERACNILGIPQTASSEEIREQYRYKAQLLHPDKTIGKPEVIRKKAEEEFKQVNQAYKFLQDPSNNPYSKPPKLKITPQNIRFKEMQVGQKKQTAFQINNIGGLYTNIWIDDQLPSWLQITRVHSLTSETLPVEVEIEATGIEDIKQKLSYNMHIKLENEKTNMIDEAIVKIELWRQSEFGFAIVEFGITIDITDKTVKKIIDWICDDYKRNQGIDLQTDRMALLRLREVAKKARDDLMYNQQTEINLPFITKANNNEMVHIKATLTWERLQKLPLVQDFTPLTIGIEGLDGITIPIIKRNAPIPISRSFVITTICDNQKSIEINVVQGEKKETIDNSILFYDPPKNKTLA